MMADPTYTVRDYQTLIQRLRRDLAAQMPERAKDIFIVDQSADPDRQIAEAADYLGVPDLRERLAKAVEGSGEFPAINGKNLTFRLSDDPPRTVHIAYGWGYHYNLYEKAPETPIHNTDFYGLAKVTVHELGHALQLGNAEKRPDALELEGGMALELERMFQESFAEVFALDVMRRIGLMPPDGDSTVNAGYDMRKYYGRDGHVRHGYSNAGVSRPMIGDFYDPSEEYAALLREYPGHAPYRPGEVPEHFPLRDSFKRSLEVVTRLRPNAVESYAIYMIGEESEAAIAHMRKAGVPEAEISQWADARPWLFPERVQADAGRDYIAMYSAMKADYDARNVPLSERLYPPYETPDVPLPSLEKTAAQAWLQHAATHDPMDRWLAQRLTEDLLMRDELGLKGATPDHISGQEEARILNNMQLVGWAEEALAGADLAKIFETMAKSVQYIPDDPNYVPPSYAPSALPSAMVRTSPDNSRH